MKRFAYAVAVYAATLGTLCAQQPGAAVPAPLADPPKAPAVAPAAVGASRNGKAGTGSGAERTWRREGEQGGKQGVPGAFMDRLLQEHPELHKRLSKLYQEDRDQFFQEVRKLMRERGLQVPDEGGTGNRGRRDAAEEQKCSELGRRYQASQDPAEKEQLRTELAAAIQAAFEARLRGSQERIARLEQQLKEFRQRLEHMEANREKICAERLEELTLPAELRWDGNW